MALESKNTDPVSPAKIAQAQDKLATASPEEIAAIQAELKELKGKRTDSQVNSKDNKKAPASEGERLLQEAASIINNVPKSDVKGTGTNPLARIGEIMNSITKLLNALAVLLQARETLNREGKDSEKVVPITTQVVTAVQQEKTNLEGVKLSAQDDASKQKEQHPEKAAGLA